MFGVALCPRLDERVSELLELDTPPMELDEDGDLGAQNLGHDGDRDIVDGPDFVATQPIELGDLGPGDEDDRRTLETGMLAHEPRHLESVHPRHVDVEEEDSEIVLEQPSERIGAGGRQDAVHVQDGEDGFVGQQARRLVVNQEHTRRASRHRPTGDAVSRAHQSYR